MKSTQILIVDDDPSIRKFVRANLEARDYSVLLAEDGEEAMRIIEKELPDLIILDIMMPKKDGFTLAEDVRKMDKNIPIIFLTARDTENDLLTGFNLGADDYITKPFSIRAVQARVKAVLKRVKVASA